MKKSKDNCDYATCLLCRLCLKDWLPVIAANKKNFKYKKGELIFKEGDEVQGIFFVYNGLVKVHEKWGGEKELIVRFAKAGDILGHRGLGKDMIYPVSATTLEASTVCFIGIDFFNATSKVNHDFIFELMMFFANELKESEKNMRNLAHMTVKGRLAQAILNLKNKFGLTKENFIDIELSRQHIASYVGTTYETVFRILGELTANKLIEISGKRISIISEENLIALTLQ